MKEVIARRGFLKNSIFSTLGISTFGYLEKLYAFESKYASHKQETSFCTHHNLLRPFYLSREGEIMNDGRKVPPRHDGMACFDLPNGNWMLIRNHENSLSIRGLIGQPKEKYDRACGGGTTNVEIDRQFNVIAHHSSLMGTMVNCSGGKTPWGTWLSCEEFVDSSWMPLNKRHGYVFEVSPLQAGLQEAKPLKAMGRFKHEGVAVDKMNEVLYLTEDLKDGLFYRFTPHYYPDLTEGKLEALKVVGANGLNTGLLEWDKYRELDVEWVTIDDPDPKKDTVRHEGYLKGAATFNRGEGVCAFGEKVYFCATAGGKQGYGQIFYYKPISEKRGKLELVYQPSHPKILNNPDNICINKYGDLIICEDGGYRGNNRIFGIRPDGKIYWIASNPHSEWTGVCLADDETALFCNIQGIGVTTAFTGDFSKLREQTMELV